MLKTTYYSKYLDVNFTGLFYFKMANGFYTFWTTKPPLVMGIVSLFVSMIGFYGVGTYIRNNEIKDPNISEVNFSLIFRFIFWVVCFTPLLMYVALLIKSPPITQNPNCALPSNFVNWYLLRTIDANLSQNLLYL